MRSLFSGFYEGLNAVARTLDGIADDVKKTLDVLLMEENGDNTTRISPRHAVVNIDESIDEPPRTEKMGKKNTKPTITKPENTANAQTEGLNVELLSPQQQVHLFLFLVRETACLNNVTSLNEQDINTLAYAIQSAPMSLDVSAMLTTYRAMKELAHTRNEILAEEVKWAAQSVCVAKEYKARSDIEKEYETTHDVLIQHANKTRAFQTQLHNKATLWFSDADKLLRKTDETKQVLFSDLHNWDVVDAWDFVEKDENTHRLPGMSPAN